MANIYKVERRELQSLLSRYGLPMVEAMFHGEGIALLANFVNLMAKWDSEYWYTYKAWLVNRALTECTGWIDYDQAIVYLETSVGQVSFHMLDDIEAIEDPMRSVDVWEGPGSQGLAIELIQEYLDVV